MYNYTFVSLNQPFKHISNEMHKIKPTINTIWHVCKDVRWQFHLLLLNVIFEIYRDWDWVCFLNQACVGQRPACAWFLEIAFVHEVGVCVSAPKAINYIHVIFNLYNQLNKFVTFRNIMKQFFVWVWPFSLVPYGFDRDVADQSIKFGTVIL